MNDQITEHLDAANFALMQVLESHPDSTEARYVQKNVAAALRLLNQKTQTGKERDEANAKLRARGQVCEICWTNSYEPCEATDAGAVPYKDGSGYVRCKHCYMMEGFVKCKSRAETAEAEVASLKQQFVYDSEALKRFEENGLKAEAQVVAFRDALEICLLAVELDSTPRDMIKAKEAINKILSTPAPAVVSKAEIPEQLLDVRAICDERDALLAQVVALREALRNLWSHDVQCDCTVVERNSGHKTGCWMPAFVEDRNKATCALSTPPPPVVSKAEFEREAEQRDEAEMKFEGRKASEEASVSDANRLREENNSLRAELRRSKEALKGCAELLHVIKGCYDAAEFEGLLMMLETDCSDRIKDVLQRRILYPYNQIEPVLTAAQSALEQKEQV